MAEDVTDPHYDRGIAFAQRRIQAHVAALAGLSAAIDIWLVAVGSWVESPHDPDAVRAEWARPLTDGRLKRWKRISAGWPEGLAIHCSIREAFTYRGMVIHSEPRLQLPLPPESASIRWDWQRIDRDSGRDAREPIDFDQFDVWEERLHALSDAIGFIFWPLAQMLQADPSLTLAGFSIHDSLVSATEGEGGDRSGLDWVFRPL